MLEAVLPVTIMSTATLGCVELFYYCRQLESQEKR